MPASNYWVTIDSFPYRLSEILPQYEYEPVYNTGAQYLFDYEDPAYEHTTIPGTDAVGNTIYFTSALGTNEYGGWRSVESETKANAIYNRYLRGGSKIKFAGRGAASFPLSAACSGIPDPSMNTGASWAPVLIDSYSSAPSGTSGMVTWYAEWSAGNNACETRYTYNGGTKTHVYNNQPNPEGLWVFIQAAGGGGAGVDWTAGGAGGGGGGGAWALVYLPVKRLYDSGQAAGSNYYYYYITLGAPGAAGSTGTTDRSAAAGKDAVDTTLYARCGNATYTLLTLGGGKGGSSAAYDQAAAGGTGGAVTINKAGTSFPLYYLADYGSGGRGGSGLSNKGVGGVLGSDCVSAVSGAKSFGLPGGASFYWQRPGPTVSGSTTADTHYGVSSYLFGNSSTHAGSSGATPCSCTSWDTGATHVGAGGYGGWSKYTGAVDTSIVPHAGYEGRVVVAQTHPMTGYQAFTSAPTLTAESNSGNLDMKITNSNSFATTVRVSINGGQAYEGAIAAGGSVYVRDVMGRSLPLYSSTYVRAIFTSGVNTSELATGYCTTSTDAGS